MHGFANTARDVAAAFEHVGLRLDTLAPGDAYEVGRPWGRQRWRSGTGPSPRPRRPRATHQRSRRSSAPAQLLTRRNLGHLRARLRGGLRQLRYQLQRMRWPRPLW